MSGDHGDLPLAARVRRLEELLAARGLVTDAELDAVLDRLLNGASPVNGARLVAHAWTHDAFRSRLLRDGTAAAQELGLLVAHPGEAPPPLVVVENTSAVHHVVVCTLCSCYPVLLLGPSPTWYRSEAYRSRVVREPRAVLAEFGLALPSDTAIEVHDASAQVRYLVLPRRPAGSEGLGEGALAALVTRRGLIGTAAV